MNGVMLLLLLLLDVAATAARCAAALPAVERLLSRGEASRKGMNERWQVKQSQRDGRRGGWGSA